MAASLASRRALPLLAALLALLGLLAGRPAQAAPTSIVYTGQLLSSTSPPTAANGTYDFQFQLFNAATGGTQVGPTVSLASVPVVDGVYNVQLSFGNVFTGQTLWLQVSYRVHPTSGSPAYTTLSPRQVAPNSAFADYATLSGSTQGLQTKAVSTAYPTTGQVLTYNGTLWGPGLVGAAGLTVPLSLSGSSANAIVQGSNAGGGQGVYGVNTGSGDYGFLGGTDPQFSAPAGVVGSDAGDGFGVVGINRTVGAFGFLGGSDQVRGNPAGVFGSDTSSSGGTGVYGNSANGTGVYGVSTSGFGVNGVSAEDDGVQGQTAVSYHSGVAGINTGSGDGQYTGNAPGVYGENTVSGAYGFLGGIFLGSPTGVFGSGGSSFGVGVHGESGGYAGVDGLSNSGDGVDGTSQGSGFGLYGYSASGDGVYGYSASGIGVYGESNDGNGTAGQFNGDVVITGTTSNAASGSKIDHPLDPAHKYLSHASVQSDRMEDVYHGHAILDANGAATVTMPAWFQSLNTDFEYTLTCVGGFAPVYVSQEIADNRFAIAGGRPGLKVSWQVTGVRHDAFALAHPLQVEEDKPAGEQGTYQNPEAFGLPESAGVGYARRQAHARPAPPSAP